MGCYQQLPLRKGFLLPVPGWKSWMFADLKPSFLNCVFSHAILSLCYFRSLSFNMWSARDVLDTGKIFNGLPAHLNLLTVHGQRQSGSAFV